MRSETQQALHKIRETLTEAARYDHAGSLLSFDMETICPPKAMEEQGDLVSFIQNKAFSLRHTPGKEQSGFFSLCSIPESGAGSGSEETVPAGAPFSRRL